MSQGRHREYDSERHLWQLVVVLLSSCSLVFPAEEVTPVLVSAEIRPRSINLQPTSTAETTLF